MIPNSPESPILPQELGMPPSPPPVRIRNVPIDPSRSCWRGCSDRSSPRWRRLGLRHRSHHLVCGLAHGLEEYPSLRDRRSNSCESCVLRTTSGTRIGSDRASHCRVPGPSRRTASAIDQLGSTIIPPGLPKAPARERRGADHLRTGRSRRCRDRLLHGSLAHPDPRPRLRCVHDAGTLGTVSTRRQRRVAAAEPAMPRPGIPRVVASLPAVRRCAGSRRSGPQAAAPAFV